MKRKQVYISLSILGVVTLWFLIFIRQTPPDLTGYVIQKTPNRLLIQAERPKNMRPYGGRERYYELIWVNEQETNYDVGDYVDVWYHSISQHYPRVANTKKMRRSSKDKRQETFLTRKQVIQKVYKGHRPHPAEIFVIDRLDYDNNKALWHIDLYDVFSERCQSFTFDDHV